MTDEELWRLDHDLSSALSHNSVVLPAPIAEILATIEGRRRDAATAGTVPVVVG